MNEFNVYPAIDLRDGQVVRLKQGDPDRQTTYDHSPGAVARRWLNTGARWLHVVNLDGAFQEDDAPNLQGLRHILEEVRKAGGKVQFGGGIRTIEDVDVLLSLGVTRVILGTAAAQNPEMVQELVDRVGTREVAVGVDVKEGVVQVQGWTRGTHLEPITYGTLLRDKGLKWAIYTDVQRDGVGSGLNVKETHHFQKETGLEVIAAGGVSSLDDVRRARRTGLRGVIIGRALYEGDVVLTEALHIAEGGS